MQLRRLIALSPIQRRLLLMVVDALLLSFSVWMSFWLRLAHPFSPQVVAVGSWLVPAAPLLGLPLYVVTGQYKGLSRYVGSRALYDLGGRTAVLTLLLVALGSLLRWPMPPRSSWMLFWILVTGFTGAARFVLRDLMLGWQRARQDQVINTVIYGAGAAGAQLAKSLLLDHKHALLAFVDDDSRLWGRTLAGVDVISPQELFRLEADRVLLAMPSLKRVQRRRIVDQLQDLGVPVLQVPSIEEITSGRARIDSLRPLAIEELLGRDPVPPNPELLGPGIRAKAVLVSGAGGSIGSELCRQILLQEPRRLVLLERSEPSLYAIEQELGELLPDDIELRPVLGSVSDPGTVERVLRDHAVEVIFHAAAYKHVPMVEANPLAALHNNLMATEVIARAAIAAGVESFTLISTDKAVRPTNVMGATKRSAELVIQALAQELEAASGGAKRRTPTCLAMVRFGNVLGSSGSVVPLFRRQIARGGPITLTHPEITRYFMTITEAAQLVIQAAVLARGGDLFLLDMGEPVRIKSLAEQMLRLSGLSLRDASRPDGDIEIVCTGLRPGEKLYEELLIDDASEPTEHPLIYRASERSIPPDQLWPLLERMEQAVRRNDEHAALELLAELVPEWQPSAVPFPVGSASVG